jgi:flagellar hook-basal body complex protein FliE
MIDTALDLPLVKPTGIDRTLQPGVGGAATKAIGGDDFSSFLSANIAEVSRSLYASEATASAGIRGEASVQQVVESIMQAERQLHMALALRDKVISAYLEISRMTI